MLLLYIILLFVISIVIHISAIAIVGSMLGARVLELGIFIGPTLLSLNIRGTTFRLNLIPLGGYVKFPDHEQTEYNRDTLPEGSVGKLHPVASVTIAAAGCIALILMSIACLGFQNSFTSFLNAFPQLFLGSVFTKTGSEIVAGAVAGFKTDSLHVSLGLICIKFAAVNLLPLPILNGGDMILHLFRWLKPNAVWSQQLLFMSFFLVVALWIGWGWAFTNHLLR